MPTDTQTHDTAVDADGRVHCSCGEISPRLGTVARRREWTSHHKRTAKTAEPYDPAARRITDAEALARIGAMLGAANTWSGDLCTPIAELIGQTGRAFPGDRGNTRAWRAYARDHGIDR